MTDVIEKCLTDIKYIAHPVYEDYVLTDAASRELANSIIAKQFTLK
jgi:1-deoxy-D-xylulose-5-phosphate reductoisomerase